MELSYIKENVNTDFSKLKDDIKAAKPRPTYLKATEEYNPETHSVVTDSFRRPDKIIEVGTEEKPEQATVYVARLPVPFQKKIVRMRATFLCGNPVELKANPKDEMQEGFLEVIKKTWDDNKLDYKNKAILKAMMSDMESAELWYLEDTDSDYWVDTVNAGKTQRLRVKTLDAKNNNLYPVYDEFDDMIAFGREYDVLENNGSKTKNFDLYTADTIYYSSAKLGGFTLDRTEVNTFKKIPVIYYHQDAPEWADVQRLIEQYEAALSDHTDSNGYNLDPMTVVEGKVLSYSKKGEKGRVLEVDPGTKISLLEFQQATESRELEQKNLKGHILDDTATPDISFEKMANIGGNLTNFGVKMMFLDAHMAAAEKEEIFGEAIQRRINFLKAAHVLINPKMKSSLILKITPKFEYYLPKNDAERIDLLRSANGGKAVMSVKSTIAMNPLIEDAETEEAEMLKEQQAEASLMNNEM